LGSYLHPGCFGYACLYRRAYINSLKAMHYHRENQSSWLIKVIFILGLVLIALVGFSIYKETQKKKQVQQQIDQLKEEAKRIERENNNLTDKINYLQSKDFQEKEARDKFNLQNPSESVVVINPGILKDSAPENNSPQDEKKVVVKKSNWEKWWDYFFSK
jgi:cell division protein FtsL